MCGNGRAPSSNPPLSNHSVNLGRSLNPSESQYYHELELATDWLGRLGRRGFEALVESVVKQSVDSVVRDRVEPRLVSIENRLAAVETRLDVADRIAKLEVEAATLKGKS